MQRAPKAVTSPESKQTRHGGEIARRWRRAVGRLASAAVDDRTFTLKFPLALPGSQRVDFEQAGRLYDTVEGTGPGSLTAFVLGMQLAGFRLFTSVAEAQSFRKQALFDPARFRQATEAHFGIAAPGFTPAVIASFLQTKPRKDLERYGADDLAARLYFRVSQQRLDHKADAGLADVCRSIGHALAGRFPTWDALVADPSASLGAVDAFLQSVSPDFPCLAAALAHDLPGMADCPLAYEGPAHPGLDVRGHPTWLHLTVARHLPAAQSVATTAARLAPAVQNLILSSQDNGLSWLFNSGLDYFRNATPKQIAQDFGVPAGAADALELVCELARKVPAPVFLDLRHYADFRRTVAGKLRSWIANYLNRLAELDSLISTGTCTEPAKELVDAERDGLFDGLAEELLAWRSGTAAIPAVEADARGALDRLMARAPGASAHDVECIDRLAEALRYTAGFERMLIARVEQRAEALGQAAYGAGLLRWVQQRVGALDRIPALPRISGGLPNLAEEPQRRTTLLRQLLHLQRAFKDCLRHALGPGKALPALLAGIRRKEAGGLASHPRAAEWLEPARLEELAARRFLSRLAGLHTRLSQARQVDLRAIISNWRAVPDEKLLNRWLINRHGQMYRSPWSTARHEPLPLRPGCWHDAEWLGDIQSLSDGLGPGKPGATSEQLRDWLQIEQTLIRTLAEALDGEYPQEVLAGLDWAPIGMAPQMRLALERPVLPAQDIRRLAGLLQGEVSKIVQDCLRTDVMVRAKFQVIDSAELIYVPKARTWRIPDRYVGSALGIGRALASLESHGEVDAAQLGTAAAARLKGEPDGASFGALLAQIPHDWHMPNLLQASAGPDDGASSVIGLRIGKGRSKARTWGASPSLGRLVGVSSFKTVLDRVLLDDRTKFGDLMLIVDQHFAQTLTPGVDGLEVHLTPSTQRVEVAVPINTYGSTVDPADAEKFFGRVVAIDLGERRIGYAVFDLQRFLTDGVAEPVRSPDGELLMGSVGVPSVRRLIQEVKRYRKRDQPGQKIGDRYSRRLEQYRENVAADVCHAIDALCAEHGGFPVLESSVRNFEDGARQLDLVYKSVLNRYTFSAVDAHKTIRKQRWFGADKWVHPYAKAREWDEEKRQYGSKAKPLNLFPGATVSPAGTSQTCWKCQRNPVQALRGLGGHVHVDEGGLVHTEVGEIRLLSGRSYDSQVLRRARREKRNLPLNRPVAAGRYQSRDVERYLKMTMRQPPLSQLAKDTTQSRYQCVFIDCGSSHHADEGAAVNIGVKFLRERIAPG